MPFGLELNLSWTPPELFGPAAILPDPPPGGMLYMVDEDGAYILDEDSAYITVETA